MNSQRRHLIARIDRFCGRCNDGLTAVAIVFAIIVSLLGAIQGAHALRVPENYEPVGTTT
jgi:hypothetical protein